MLLRADQQKIRRWVVDCFDQDQFETFLVRCGGHRLEAFSSKLHQMEVVAVNFVEWLHHHPDAIAPILETAALDFVNRDDYAPALVEIAERCRVATIRACLPWNAVLVRRVPVANRAPLRSILSSTLRGRGRGVVMIDGPSGTGRSHSWHLIREVADESGCDAHLFDLDAFAIEDRTIENLFERMVRRLRLTATRPTTTGATATTVAARYTDSLVDALHADPRAFWLGFDGLDQRLVPEIKMFLAQLASSRLRMEPDKGMIFLLGADQDFGIDDRHRLIETETLTEILPDEFSEAAVAINALGAGALDASALREWIQQATVELGTLRGHEAGEFVCSKLIDLRDLVAAF